LGNFNTNYIISKTADIFNKDTLKKIKIAKENTGSFEIIQEYFIFRQGNLDN
jgi:hypothetical protein